MTRPAPIPNDLRALFDAACNDTLTPEQVAQLEARLRDDPTLARAYLEYFNLQSDLHFLTRSQAAAKSTLASVAAARPTGWRQRIAGLMSGTTPLSLAIAAVVVSAIVGVMAFIMVPFRPANSHREWQIADREIVAQISRSIDAHWTGSDAGKSAGDHLHAGQRLDLSEGLIEITFLSGARVILQGPAKLVLVSDLKGDLESGRVTAVVPESAHGFTVQTPLAELVDLGTQFGVAVDPSPRAVQLHVFAGQVQLTTIPASGKQAQVRLLRAGEAIRVSDEQSLESLASDEKSFVRALPLATAKLPAPAHQWTFNDGDARDTAGGAHGTLESGASIAGGRLHLDGGPSAIFRTAPIDNDLRGKTLVSWASLNTLDQKGGSILTLESADGVVFDGIVFAELTPRQWMAGSNSYRRSPVDNAGKKESQTSPATVMLAIVYRSDGMVVMYRNGVIYAGYRTEPPPNYVGGSAHAIFGRRHTGGLNWQMNASIDEARIYPVPLSPSQIQRLYDEGPTSTPDPQASD